MEEGKGGGGGVHLGILDLLADHEQEFDELGVCAGLSGSLDDLQVPAVVRTPQVALDRIADLVGLQLRVT
jgi:hypothetical protein